MAPTLASLVDTPALGARPFLTWYATGGERVELSAAVTANWVAKTANLLVEEFDAGPGTTIALALPAHWRTAVWALATWRVGAAAAFTGPEAGGSAAGGPAAGGALDVDVLVTDSPGRLDSPDDLAGAPRAAATIAVSLPALARRFDGPLPPGAIDAAAAVMTYGDQVGYVPPLDPAAPAVVASGGVAAVTHAGLLDWAGGAGVPGGERLTVTVGDRTPTEVAACCRTVLAALAAGSSLVLLATDLAAELAADLPRRDRLLATEHATLWPGSAL